MLNRQRRLYRSTDERTIAGVAAGLAEYFGISPIIVRISFIFSIFAGFGFPLYLLFWALTPRDPAEGYPERNLLRFLFSALALFLLLLAAVFVVHVTGHELTALPFLIGLGIGMFFLFRGRRTDADEESASRGRRYTQSIDDEEDEVEAKLAGVCLRIARAFGIDPVIVRVVSVILIPITFPLVPILYVLAALVMPKSTGVFSR